MYSANMEMMLSFVAAFEEERLFCNSNLEANADLAISAN